MHQSAGEILKCCIMYNQLSKRRAGEIEGVNGEQIRRQQKLREQGNTSQFLKGTSERGLSLTDLYWGGPRG